MAMAIISEKSHYSSDQGGDGKVFGDADDEAAQNLKKLGYQQELTRVRSCNLPTSQRLNMDLERLIVSRIIPHIVQYVAPSCVLCVDVAHSGVQCYLVRYAPGLSVMLLPDRVMSRIWKSLAIIAVRRSLFLN